MLVNTLSSISGIARICDWHLPKKFLNEKINKAPSTPVTRKKQVTFNDKPGTSSSNTQKHEVHQKVQQTNVPVIHSTGVNTSTEASGSKPRSNTKKNRIMPAKSENKKKVEDHPRTNKSVWTKVNRVDSSISSKRVIWKPKGKLSDNSLNKTKQVWKATGKLFANVGYQWRSTGKKVALGKLNCGYQWRPTGKKFALGELCPLTKLSVQCRTGHPLVSRLRLFKTYDGESFKAQELSYADADHAGCQDSRRSTSGSAQFLGDRLVSWSSKKQRSTDISTTEVEYIAMSGCFATMSSTQNLSQSNTKPFHSKKVENGVVELYFVETNYQLADILTKALPKERFEFLLPQLGMKSLTLETLKRLQEEKGTISLIPLSRGSFDVLVGMDRLSKRKFGIVCHEKVVRIPLEGDEILRVHGERTQGVMKTLMNTKTKVSYDLVIFREEHQCCLLRRGAWSSFEVRVGITEEGEVVC
ncbi:hypothetical protein Tco_0033336 [Tanacetum coccineum]